MAGAKTRKAPATLAAGACSHGDEKHPPRWRADAHRPNMVQPASARRAEIVDFADIAPVACPCGQARRAFAEVADFPGTIHQTEISTDARAHYHRRLTEVYYILECGPDARIELNGELLPVAPGMCVMIRPLVRHRAVGKMKVLVIVYPKFDPADEWFD